MESSTVSRSTGSRLIARRLRGAQEDPHPLDARPRRPRRCAANHSGDSDMTSDVSAFGGYQYSMSGIVVQTLDPASTSDWSGEWDGTSYSAPTVTSLVAHVRKECQQRFGSNLPPGFLRALFRTAAWGGNPQDGLYSTPSDVFDWADGAGWIDATALDWFCHSSGGSTGGAGSITIDLEGGSNPTGVTTEYRPGYPKPQGYHPLDYTEPSNGSFARKEYLLAQASLSIGDRVRVTISYDVCGDDPLASSSVGVDIDLDLYLYNSSTSAYIYGSQSLHDNNEGFDVIISDEDGNGDYQLLISRPEDQKSHCGDKNMVLWWAGRWGSPW